MVSVVVERTNEGSELTRSRRTPATVGEAQRRSATVGDAQRSEADVGCDPRRTGLESGATMSSGRALVRVVGRRAPTNESGGQAAACPPRDSLDTQARDRPGDDQLLDLAGAFEDRVAHLHRFCECRSVLPRLAHLGFRESGVRMMLHSPVSSRDE